LAQSVLRSGHIISRERLIGFTNGFRECAIHAASDGPRLQLADEIGNS
jgi:hypothetical protein